MSMTRLIYITAFISLITTGAHAQEEAINSQLDVILKRAKKLFNNHDAEGISKLYAEETDVIHAGDKPRESRKQMQEAYADFFKTNPSVRTKYTDAVRTILTPDIVIESGVWEDSGKSETEAETESGRYSTVFKKTDGKWLIVYERAWKNP